LPPAVSWFQVAVENGNKKSTFRPKVDERRTPSTFFGSLAIHM